MTEITCVDCDYSWKPRKKRPKTKRQCPKCFSYNLTEEGAVADEKPVIVSTEVDDDPEIIELKRELRKAQLREEISEVGGGGTQIRLEYLEKMVLWLRNTLWLIQPICPECYTGKIVSWDEGSMIKYGCDNCGATFMCNSVLTD